jgi:hypothetical protein
MGSLEQNVNMIVVQIAKKIDAILMEIANVTINITAKSVP